MDGSEHNVNTEVTQKAPLQLSDALDRLLANPELLSTVAAAIGASPPAEVGGNTINSQKNDTNNDSEAEAKKDSESEAVSANTHSEDISQKLPDLMSNVAPVIAALSGRGGKQPDDDRTRLLCALKPYVNPHRRDAIDTMVQLARISEVIKTVK